MRAVITCLVVLAPLLAPALAAADEAPPPPPRTPDVAKMTTSDCAKARKQNRPCVIDMGGEQLEGNSPTAGGSAFGAIQFHKADSLIRIRRDFIVEILKTAEDL